MRTIFSGASAFAFVITFAVVCGAQERKIYPPPVYGGFEVEVLVDGWPLERLSARGRTYVEARQGAEYELRIRNPLPVRVAVALSVDGLNTIDARRTSARDASKWVIEPYGTIRVGGWQMSTERARRFYFTTERDSYAARLGRASDMGVITAVFFREDAPQITRRRPRPYPLEGEDREGATDERAENSQAPRASAGAKPKSGRESMTVDPGWRDDDYAATGIGRSVHNNVYLVNMNLEPNPVSQITIRYEYRPALIQLGVLPRNPPPVHPLQRRERARGFEDPRFSPEP